MTDGKVCPKCSKKELNEFCGALLTKMEDKNGFDLTEWNKTHKVPEMVFCGNFSNDTKDTDLDAYQCPICGYVEFWGGMRKK